MQGRNNGNAISWKKKYINIFSSDQVLKTMNSDINSQKKLMDDRTNEILSDDSNDKLSKIDAESEEEEKKTLKAQRKRSHTG